MFCSIASGMKQRCLVVGVCLQEGVQREVTASRGAGIELRRPRRFTAATYAHTHPLPDRALDCVVPTIRYPGDAATGIQI